jgi:hypothetical protein
VPRFYPLLALLLLVVAGCGPVPAVGPARQAGPQVVNGVFAVETPVPWNFEYFESPTMVIWTQDEGGYMSQLVFITGLRSGGSYSPARGSPLFFPEMTPEEIARMILNSHVQHGGHSEALVHEVTKAEFAGHPGFRFTYGYLARQKLPVRTTFMGTVVDDQLYMIGFAAREEQGVYVQGWPTAEHIIQSARIIGAT